MGTAAFIFSWWLAGAAGGVLLWVSLKSDYPKEFGRCPTRKGALGIALFGILGFCGLLVGVLITLIDWINTKGGWWSKPIC